MNSLWKKTGLETHLKDEHSIFCQICKIEVNSNSELKKHMLTVHTVKCPSCNEELSSQTDLQSHIENTHVFPCTACDVKFETLGELKLHDDSTHKTKDVSQTNEKLEDIQDAMTSDDKTFECTLCDVKTETKEEMKKHTEDEHFIACNLCNKKFSKKSEMENHNLAEHNFTCVFCTFTGSSEEMMEDHILDMHAKPDKDSYFKCDDCSYKVLEKESFRKHFKENHSRKATKATSENQNEEAIEVVVDDEADKANDDEARKVKAELKLLKSNFDRLQGMYYESLDEVNKVKSEYEETFRKVIGENEVLKEKVDILFKLGRSYINNATKSQKSDSKTTTQEEEIEVIEEDDDLENLHDWTQNKMRGFRRVDPSKPPSNSKSNDNKSNKVNPPSAKSTKPLYAMGF